MSLLIIFSFGNYILLILILFFAYAGQWAAEIKRKDIKNRKENKEKGNSNEELP